MERHVELHDSIKTEVDSACTDSTRETHAPEMSAVSNSRLGEATIVKRDAEQGKSLEYLQASQFVCMIKEHFPSDREVLKRFLDILESYYSEKKSVQVLHREAANLFNDHELLLRALPHFMPDQEHAAQG